MKYSITTLALRASLRCFMKVLEELSHSPFRVLSPGEHMLQMWGPNEDKHPILVCTRPLEQLTPWVHAAQYSKILVEEKTQNMPVWISKMVLAQHFFSRGCWDWQKGSAKPNTCSSWLARWFDWSKRFVIINLPVSVSVL